jgi:hypothetical protein
LPLNGREEVVINLKDLDRIKIEAITSYVSPKSKKNIYFTNRHEKHKNHFLMLRQYYEFKAKAQNVYMAQSCSDSFNTNKQRLELSLKEYEQYLVYYTSYESITDCLHKN